MTNSVVLIRKRNAAIFYRIAPQTLSRPSTQHHHEEQDRPSVTILKS
jgi:hypothetical protein